MSKEFEVIVEAIPNQDKGLELMHRLADAADNKAVFSEPVTVGDYTVITANEVSIGLGFGFGGGGGIGIEMGDEEDEQEERREGPSSGYGSGGGGGGGASARPVALIAIGPGGVHVEPIVDATKIAVAFFTTILGMLGMLAKMRKG